MSTTISALFWFLERKVENYMESGVGTSGTSVMLFVLASPMIFRALSHTPKLVNPFLGLAPPRPLRPANARTAGFQAGAAARGGLQKGGSDV